MCRSVLLLVVLHTVVLFAACGGDDSAISATQEPSGASQTAPPATTDIDPLTGLPRSFPGDFPILDGTSVSRASEYTDRYVIEWRSESSYEDATAFYRTKLTTVPWRVDSTQQTDEATVFQLSGGSTSLYTGSLAVAKLADGARILLELHPDEAR